MQKFSNLIGGGLLAILDQSVVSASTFTLTIIVGRSQSPSDFGQFTILYMLILVATSIQSALVTQPHAILGPSFQGSDFRSYTTSSASLQVYLSILISVFLLIVSLVLYLISSSWATPLMCVSVVIFPVQMQEYLRRVLYTRFRIYSSLINSIVVAGSRILLLCLFWQSGMLSPLTALAAIGISAGIGSVIGLIQIRQYLTFGRAVFLSYRLYLAEHWSLGRWLLATFSVSWLSDASYPFVLAAFVGTGAVGTLRAIETLLSPVQVIMLAVSSILLPHVAAIFQTEGTRGVRDFTRVVLLISMPIVTGLYIALAFASPLLLPLMFGQSYSAFVWLVPFMVVAAWGNYFRLIVSIPLRAVGATDAVFRAGLWLNVSVLLIGVPAIVLFGLRGFAVSLLVTSLIGSIAQWRYYHDTTRASGIDEH